MNKQNKHAIFFDCKTLEDCHNIGIYHLMDFLEIFGGEDVDAFVAADGSHFLVDAYSFNGDQIGLTLNEEATKLYNKNMPKDQQRKIWGHCVKLAKGIYEEII